MMQTRRFLLIATAVASMPVPVALAQTPKAPPGAKAAYAKDRESILGMVGNYRVRFDFRETTPFVDDYNPIDGKISAGLESVRVVEESPGKISLQHLLVVQEGKETTVVKHWRQDWVYQPAEVLTYTAAGQWRLTPVPVSERAGAWSQTVWQTDDSPRYGGVGRWDYSDGVARWMSNVTRRPLARRDAVRKPVYGWYMGTNRHALTPEGWVHEQDNSKVGMRNGKPTTFVHEVVLNTYSRWDRFPIAAADAYWAKTKDYWADVRRMWEQAILKGRGVNVGEEAENGSVTGPKLMSLADDIAEGKIDTAKALAQARTVISGETRLAVR